MYELQAIFGGDCDRSADISNAGSTWVGLVAGHNNRYNNYMVGIQSTEKNFGYSGYTSKASCGPGE